MDAGASKGAATGRPIFIEDAAKRQRVIAQIVPLIEHGMTIIKACEASGIPQTTFYRYKQLGKEVDLRLQAKDLLEPDETFDAGEKAVWEFWKAVNGAELSCLDRCLLTVQVASQNHWQAAAWWLERRFPKDYGRNYQIQHTGSEESPVVVKEANRPTREDVLRKLTPEQLSVLAQARAIVKSVTAVVDEDEAAENQE